MRYLGIFADNRQKTEFYNDMFFKMETANPPLRKRMSKAFANFRATNREWDKLLDELKETASPLTQ